MHDLILFAQSRGGYWLPPPDSSTAGDVDRVFYFILGVASFFFVLIVALMCLFVILYRRRPGVEAPGSASHNNLLEITWTIIPVILVVIMFYMGFTTYLDIRTSPRQAYDIRVVGQKWSWVFSYPNGHVAPELHVPVDRPVRLTMTSEDVIHSLFIPAFRVKMDLVPGRYTTTWFHPLRAGTYDLYCTEYCGTGHSDMLSKVVVHKPGEFETWLEQAANLLASMTPVEAGAELTRRNGCLTCHSTDGTAKVGPSFKGIYGQRHTFTNGTSAEVDDNYIRQSILEPMALIRQGYQPAMPTYKGRLKDQEITAIIEYIESLK
ncbi:MAG: cytochrome c oxidase subunit II [Pirellulales bacterium]|nr:cytochrome c oxidase subunit II [Pirellulales bacterium]